MSCIDYRQVKASVIVKQGTPSEISTVIHKAKLSFENLLVEIRIMLFKYFGDGYSLVKLYQEALRILFTNSQTKSAEMKFHYRELAINTLDLAIPRIHKLQEETNTTMATIEAMRAQIENATTMANKEIQENTEVRVEVDKMNLAITGAQDKLDRQLRRKRIRIKQMEEQRATTRLELKKAEVNYEKANDKYFAKLVEVNKKLNITEQRHFNYQKKLIDRLIKHHNKIMEVPMPRCMLSSKPAGKDELELNQFAKCKITLDETHVPKLDVVFVIDGGCSISYSDFNRQKQFVIDIAAHTLENSVADLTFSLLQYSRGAQWEYKNLKHIGEITAATNRVNQVRGGTYLVDALNAVAAFPTRGSGRTMSAIIITDGQPGDNIYTAANNLKQVPGAHIVSFGVGPGINEVTMKLMGNVWYKAPNWYSLNKYKDMFSKDLRMTMESKETLDPECKKKVLARIEKVCKKAYNNYFTVIESKLKQMQATEDRIIRKLNQDDKQIATIEGLITDAAKDRSKKEAEIIQLKNNLFQQLQFLRAWEMDSYILTTQMEDASYELKVMNDRQAATSKKLLESNQILLFIQTNVHRLLQAMGDIQANFATHENELKHHKERVVDDKERLNVAATLAREFQNNTVYLEALAKTDNYNTEMKTVYENMISWVLKAKISYASFDGLNNLPYDSMSTKISVLEERYKKANELFSEDSKKKLGDAYGVMTQEAGFARHQELISGVDLNCIGTDLDDKEYADKMYSIQPLCSKYKTYPKHLCSFGEGRFMTAVTEFFGDKPDTVRRIELKFRKDCAPVRR